LLRRPDFGRGRRGTRHLPGHRRPRLGLRPRLAVPGTEQWLTSRSQLSRGVAMTEEALFHEALARIDATERAAFLAANCADPALRARIEALLAAHGQPVGVLERPAATGAYTPSGQNLNPQISNTNDPDLGLPAERVIGPYKLLQRIGEGGM